MIELSLILLGPLFAHVMGSVSGTRCEIDEKWNVRFGRLLLTDPAYRLLGDGFGEMPLRFIVRRLNGRGILEQRRIPLIRLSSLEAIEIIEAFACGPAIIWTTGAQLVVGCIVPLSEGASGVPITLKDFPDACRFFGPLAVVAGEAGRQLGDTPIVDRVVVAPREQRRSRR